MEIVLICEGVCFILPDKHKHKQWNKRTRGEGRRAIALAK